MNGYIKVWVRSPDGAAFDCWQKVVEGTCAAYVDATDSPIAMPKVCESGCVTGDLVAAPGD